MSLEYTIVKIIGFVFFSSLFGLPFGYMIDQHWHNDYSYVLGVLMGLMLSSLLEITDQRRTPIYQTKTIPDGSEFTITIYPRGNEE